MRRNQLLTLIALALAASAWLRFLDRPTRKNLERAALRSLPLLQGPAATTRW